MPEFLMHRFLLQSLILIFAASGIACACPADLAAADEPSHDLPERSSLVEVLKRLVHV